MGTGIYICCKISLGAPRVCCARESMPHEVRIRVQIPTTPWRGELQPE